jgi:hypothetical protein
MNVAVLIEVHIAECTLVVETLLMINVTSSRPSLYFALGYQGRG